MATFRTGQQTHPPVLPQQVALESESVDTPRIGHETGLRHHSRVVPGADHVRGETTHISPEAGGVTPDFVGEQGREAHSQESDPYVFVLDKNHAPLQPCHPARARIFLNKGRAVVARHTPFPTRPQGWLAPSLRHRVETTRWALWRALDQRLPTPVGSGGRTKWNRTRNRLPKSHTLDALAVGKVDIITQTTDRVLVTGCAGRGSYARTRPDKHGFPRLRLPRTKGFFGFATGDMVRAVVPKGKKTGTHIGRVAVRASGRFNITTAQGAVQGIGHQHVRLLQRADGYGYTWKGEGVSSRT